MSERSTRAPLRRHGGSPESPPPEPKSDAEDVAAQGAVSHESPVSPSLAVLAALVLYIGLPKLGLKAVIGWEPMVWIVPTLMVALLAPLIAARSTDQYRGLSLVRLLSIGLIAVVNAANLLSLVQLIRLLLKPGGIHSPDPLLFSSVDIWLTNILVFALWFWELDRGGPYLRRSDQHRLPDFFFPQMAKSFEGGEAWSPEFADYFYVAFTNATAFSPTDTMPLTHWAKLLMTVQAFASLITVALVAARAVNILNGG